MIRIQTAMTRIHTAMIRIKTAIIRIQTAMIRIRTVQISIQTTMIRNTDEKHFLSLGEAATKVLEDPVIQALQHVVGQIQSTKHQKA
jgi:hypothetical protein